MHESPGRQRFREAIAVPDAEMDLARAALAIAQEAYPDLAIEPYLERLDGWATAARDRLPAERYPLRVLGTISAYLYDELGFRGNRDDYYDPRNSFLNDVLDRRMGIPITLSLVYLDVARRLDFPMEGIGMPGHFLIRPTFEGAGIYVDAFSGGEVLFPEDCAQRLSQLAGHPVPFRAEFLAPVSPRRFLARMLTNLKSIYIQAQRADLALGTVERLLLLFPDAGTELRDRGLLRLQLERIDDACRDLRDYLRVTPDARDRPAIEALLDRFGDA